MSRLEVSTCCKMGVWDGKKSYFKMDINMGLWKEALRSCKLIHLFIIENKEDFQLIEKLHRKVKFCKNFFKIIKYPQR
jgi:hypothetical protein